MPIRVLLVDDHQIVLDGLHSLLSSQPDVEVIGEVRDGRAAVECTIRSSPDVVVMDVSMPGMDGIEATRRIKSAQPDSNVLCLTMHAERNLVAAMLEAGATGYVLKDHSVEELLTALVMVAEGRTYVSAAVSEPDFMADQIEEFHGLISSDPQMRRLFELVRQVGSVDVPVLIQGESGTGKEMVAHALRRESPRVSRQMVTVNCGALSGNLLESELFGHVRGAFTGAARDRRGRFELAHGGTAFLDEIGELTLEMQVKLLRVLQDGTFEPIGSERSRHVDVRLISATNRELDEEVAVGRFRADLFYRLSVVVIRIPPLRERMQDVEPLAKHLLAKITDEYGLARAEMSRPFLASLMAHRWPGNVRELENALRHALIRGNKYLEPHDLPTSVLRGGAPVSYATMPRRSGLTMARVNRALRETSGNKAAASRLLGVGRATLYRFLDQS